MVRILVGIVLAGLFAVPANGARGHWVSAAPLPVPETSQVAVSLAGGDILLTGGEATEYGMPTRAAQLYQPADGTWSLLHPMHHARIGHTATTLPDGRVLVAGGLGDKLQPLRSAEIYSPAANLWSYTPPLPATRFAQSASLLPDGDVLVVGGIVGGSISATTLIYDPAANRWQPGPPTNYPHAQQDSLTLGDGRILIAGGYGGPPEIYDPARGQWSVVGSPRFRSHPLLLLLGDGTALYTSGAGPRGHGVTSSLVFDPADDRWRSTAAMNVRRNQPVGVELGDGSVLVAGGSGPQGSMLRSAQIYDPMSRSWLAAGAMRQARAAAAGVLMTNGQVLVCGGSYYGAVLDSCEIYRP